MANFTVRDGGTVVGTMEPSKRSFAARQQTTERGGADDARRQPALPVARRHRGRRRLAVRIYYKPLVLLIWLGAVVMMLGGALSLSDRRLRVGAPRPAAQAAHAAGGVIMRRLALMPCVALAGVARAAR